MSEPRNAAKADAATPKSAAFQLDTSGCVRLLAEDAPWKGLPKPDIYWTDLDPFTQGYVEALFNAIEYPAGQDTAYLPKGFSDLAPATLARIMADCEVYPGAQRDASAGARLWLYRNTPYEGGVRLSAFPPQTPYLGVDGLIYLRDGGEAVHASASGDKSGDEPQ